MRRVWHARTGSNEVQLDICHAILSLVLIKERFQRFAILLVELVNLPHGESRMFLPLEPRAGALCICMVCNYLLLGKSLSIPNCALRNSKGHPVAAGSIEQVNPKRKGQPWQIRWFC